MSFKRTKYLSLGFILLFVVGCYSTRSSQKSGFDLTILHTNDVHARVLPINRFDQTCSEDEIDKGQCFGGVAKRQTKIEQMRKLKKNTLLLDAGDQFQGTLFYTKYRGKEAAPFMNKMGYAAMAIGNHEFDDGPEALSKFIKDVNFPLLSANLDVSAEPALAGLTKPYIITKFEGERVGVIGCTTESTKDISSPGEAIKFIALEQSLNKAVHELESQGVNKIILLSHAGFKKDMELAAKIPGIDIIVAGHSNTFLSNKDKAAEGPYPVVVKSPKGEPVVLVSAYAYGKYLGHLDVQFDKDGKLKKWQGEPILLDKSVPDDLETAKAVAILEKPLSKMRNEVVGNLPFSLDGGSLNCRHRECQLGDVVSDAILESARPYGAQAVIMNGGGIRASLPQGAITRWQVVDALPFANEVAIFDLTGKEIWDSIDRCVQESTDMLNEGAACFPQVAGFDYVWVGDKQKKSGLKSLQIKTAQGQYSPVDLQKTYRVASSRFMLIGGDGYEIIASKAKNTEVLSETLDESLISYFKKQPNLNQQNINKRIVLQNR